MLGVALVTGGCPPTAIELTLRLVALGRGPFPLTTLTASMLYVDAPAAVVFRLVNEDVIV